MLTSRIEGVMDGNFATHNDSSENSIFSCQKVR